MKLFISTLLLLLMSCGAILAQVESDSTTLRRDSIVVDSLAIVKKSKKVQLQYFRIGLDVSKIIRSSLTDRYSTIEGLFETIYKDKMHLVAEGGYASSLNLGDNISFTSNSGFLRLGFDKYFFGKLYKEDLDNAFIGLRLGAAYNRRLTSSATLWDPFYGNATLKQPPSSQMLYWLGLTAGFRVELIQNVFIGWNVRGKTFLNAKKVNELTPNYLAGYGLAKKQPGLDYNFYLLYGFGKR